MDHHRHGLHRLDRAPARLYDQTQWAHAFGASSLPARTKPELSEPWRIYEWYFGEKPDRDEEPADRHAR